MKKARIMLGPVKSVLEPDRFPITKVLDVFTYRPSWAAFSPKVQEGTWDGKIRLGSMRKDGSIIFPTGLLTELVKLLKSLGYKVYYNSHIPEMKKSYKGPQEIRMLNGVTPRYYQKKAVKVGLRKMRGVFKMPTGSGKTIVGGLLTKSIRDYTIFLTHKKDIFTQTYDRFCEYFGKEYVGMVGNQMKSWNYITICMVQTLHRNWERYGEELERCGLLIVDEVHLATSPSWYNLTTKIPAEYRFGLTATPLTDSRRTLLQAATGPIIYTAKAQRLIREGYLSKPRIFMLTMLKPQLSDRFDYTAAYEAGIVQSIQRNRKIVKVAKLITKVRKLTPVVVQVKKIAHIELLESMLEQTNLRFKVLWGKDGVSERKEVIRQLEARTIDVLVVSTIFDEGVDVRNIRTLIVASGGRSDEKTIQRLGRGMRTADGKSSVILIDFMDQTHEYLERHSKRRRLIYKREGYEIERVTIKKLRRIVKEI